MKFQPPARVSATRFATLKCRLLPNGRSYTPEIESNQAIQTNSAQLATGNTATVRTARSPSLARFGAARGLPGPGFQAFDRALDVLGARHLQRCVPVEAGVLKRADDLRQVDDAVAKGIEQLRHCFHVVRDDAVGLDEQLDPEFFGPEDRGVKALADGEDPLLGGQAVAELGLGIAYGGDDMSDAEQVGQADSLDDLVC
ncbi:MAG: hypothetical protein AAB225_03955 [Acidobacteriota bacterium]